MGSGASTAQSVGGGGAGAGPGGGGGEGGAGGSCDFDRDVAVVVRNMDCIGQSVATSNTGVFVARASGCEDGGAANPTVIKYADDLQSFGSAAGSPNSAGLGMVALDEDAVLFAAQALDMQLCEPATFTCSSFTGNCMDDGGSCRPWGGLDRFGGGFIGIQNTLQPRLFTFDSQGDFTNILPAFSTDAIGYDVTAMTVDGGDETSYAWSVLEVGLEKGEVYRSLSSHGSNVEFPATGHGAPSGVAIDATETVYFAATRLDGATTSSLFVWPEDEPDAVVLTEEFVATQRSVVAVHAATGVVYASGFVSEPGGPQSVYRCACGECVRANITCSSVNGLDVRQSDGVAYFTCDTRVVRWGPPPPEP